MKWPWSRRVLTRKELGALGERHAARALHAKGFRLLDANFRQRSGELDLVARDGDTLVIVEVRTRTSTTQMTPLESVNSRKQARLVRTARRYRQQYQLFECPCRYDVVEVIATAQGHVTDVRHFPGAFSSNS
ncbi:MAG TPA: YraN family protein [Armatimonadota bacterium]|nr:YraN family protein [Armatimonadota bacterium]